VNSLLVSGQGQSEGEPAVVPVTELVETTIGDAVVYFRVDRRLEMLETGNVRPVAGAGPDKNAFEAAAHVAREAVRLFASHLSGIGEALRPSETGIEFSFTFEAKGKTAIVPVFLTGEASGQVALKVIAKWTMPPKAAAASPK
jgi:hypothetical protein